MNMKKTIFLFAVLASFVTLAKDIVLNYAFEKPEVVNLESYAAVTVKDCYNANAVGEPALPVLYRTIAIPDGMVVTKVKATLGGEGTIDLELPVEHGHPAFTPEMTEAELAAVKAQDVPNAAIYAGNGPYPDPLVKCGEIEFMNAYPVATLKVVPVRYFPAAKRLAYATAVTVTVTVEESPDAPHPSLKRHLRKRAKVQSKVDNPDDVAEVGPQPLAATEHYDIVFLTTTALQPLFADLLQHYADRGFSVKVLTMENDVAPYTATIPNATGKNYTYKRVRQCLVDAYNAYGNDYVVLGGDHQNIPGAGVYCPSGDSHYFNIDQYYCCLGNASSPSDSRLTSDWHYTETDNGAMSTSSGTLNWTPTVALGRLPVSTKEEIDRMVAKTIAHWNDSTDYNSAILAGTALGARSASSSGDYGANGMDEVWPIVTEAGYNVVKRFSDRPTSNGWDAYDLGAAINAYEPRLLCSHGHGQRDECFAIKGYIYEEGLVTNTHPFFATSASCHWCEYWADCFGERMLRQDLHGAWGVAGNSWYGWYNYGNEQDPSGSYLAAFVKRAMNGDETVGEAFGNSKKDYRGSSSSMSDTSGYSGLAYTLLADPTQYLRTEALRITPVNVAMSFDSATTSYPSKSFTVKNVSGASASWTLAEKPEWLDVAASGSVSAGGSSSVSVTANVNAKKLPLGNNIGYLRFRVSGATIVRKVNFYVSHTGLSTMSASAPLVMYRDLPSSWALMANASSYNGSAALYAVGGDTTYGYLESGAASLPGSVSVTGGSTIHMQTLYMSRGFSTTSGLIKKIRLRTNGERINATSATLKLKPTPREAWSYPSSERTTFETDGFTTVWAGDGVLPTNSVSGVWWTEIELPQPYVYDASQNLLMDLELTVSNAAPAKKPDQGGGGGSTSVTVKFQYIPAHGYTTRYKVGSGSVTAIRDTIAAQFVIAPEIAPAQSVALASGSGTLAYAPTKTTGSTGYLIDGVLARGKYGSLPKIRNWRLEWTTSPSGDVIVGSSKSAALRVVDDTGAALTTQADGLQVDLSGADAAIEFARDAESDCLSQLYGKARVQAAYPATHLGGACSIKSVSLYVTGGMGGFVNLSNFVVRAKHAASPVAVEKASMTPTGWTTVRASKTLVIPTDPGWFEIPFDAPFAYNGTDNLVFDFSYVTRQSNGNRLNVGTCPSAWTSCALVTARTKEPTDGGNPLDWDSTAPGCYASKNWLALRMNLADGTVSASDPSSVTLTDGVWSGSLAPLTTGANLNLCATCFGGHAGVSDPFNVVKAVFLETTAQNPTNVVFTYSSTVDGVDGRPVKLVVADDSAFTANVREIPLGTIIAGETVSYSLGGLGFGVSGYAKLSISMADGTTAESLPVAFETTVPGEPVVLENPSSLVADTETSATLAVSVKTRNVEAAVSRVDLFLKKSGGEETLVKTWDAFAEGDRLSFAAATEAKADYTYRFVAVTDWYGASWTNEVSGAFKAEYVWIDVGVLGEVAAEVVQVDETLTATMSVSVVSLEIGTGTLALALNGETVKTWSNVSAGGTYAFAANVQKGFENEYVFTLSEPGLASVTSEGTFSAALDVRWFDVRFAEYANVTIENGFADPVDGGTWTRSADDAADLADEAAARHVEFAATNAVLRYAPSKPSLANADAVVNLRLKLPLPNASDEPAVPTGAQTGLFVFPDGNGGYCYKAWTGTAWVALAGVQPTDSWIDVTVEFRYVADADREARVTIGGMVLKVAGTTDEWFAIGGTARQLGSVGFAGKGAAGNFFGHYFDSIVEVGPTIEIVRPEFAADGALGFVGTPGTEGATFAITISNPVMDAYYTVFTATELTGTFTAAADSTRFTGGETLTLEVDADTPSKFARVVVSLVPFAADDPMPE